MGKIKPEFSYEHIEEDSYMLILENDSIGEFEHKGDIISIENLFNKSIEILSHMRYKKRRKHLSLFYLKSNDILNTFNFLSVPYDDVNSYGNIIEINLDTVITCKTKNDDIYIASEAHLEDFIRDFFWVNLDYFISFLEKEINNSHITVFDPYSAEYQDIENIFGCNIGFSIHKNCSLTIIECLELIFEKVFVKLEYEVLRLFIKENGNINDKRLNLSFQFASEIRSSCEQYLIYFAQFLKDMSIEVETGISYQGDETLFSITPPDDKEETLKLIHDALAVYLNLPNNEVVAEEVVQEHNSSSARELMAQVYDLKSKVYRAFDMIERREETIERLKLQNNILLEKNEEFKKKEDVSDNKSVINNFNMQLFRPQFEEITKKLNGNEKNKRDLNQ